MGIREVKEKTESAAADVSKNAEDGPGLLIQDSLANDPGFAVSARKRS